VPTASANSPCTSGWCIGHLHQGVRNRFAGHASFDVTGKSAAKLLYSAVGDFSSGNFRILNSCAAADPRTHVLSRLHPCAAALRGG
jgi:hypothetical protein